MDTSISLSMYLPKVAERSYIEFSESSDIIITQMIDGHTALIEDLNDLKEFVDILEETQLNNEGYAGIGVGIVIAIIVLSKSKN